MGKESNNNRSNGRKHYYSNNRSVKKHEYKTNKDSATINHVQPKKFEGLIEELPMLYPSSEGQISNILKCEEKFEAYTLLHYGAIGKMFHDLEYYKPKKPKTPTNEELTEDAPHGLLKALYLQEMKTYESEKLKLKEKRPILFALLYNQMTKESQQVCSRDPSYKYVVDEKDDPLELWIIMRKTHLESQTGINALDRQAALQMQHSLKQGANESILEFKKRYEDMEEALKAVGVELMSHSDAALDFLKKLDETRYAPFVVWLNNEASLRAIEGLPPKFPDSVAKMYELAIRHKQVETRTKHHNAADTATAAIFHTSTAQIDAPAPASEKEMARRKEQSAKDKAAFIATKEREQNSNSHGGGRGGKGRGGNGWRGGSGGRSGRGGRGGNHNNRSSSTNSEGSSNNNNDDCYICGESGHRMKDCKAATEFAEFRYEIHIADV
mmetsp:Transcript_20619/g.28513  ORF Transcript_20619/g.28513 Transcript_20619/m.28513 type:complete len:440 (-) Transcript_20619:688-2007(-)